MWGFFADTEELPASTALWLVRERREWLSGRYVSVNWDMEELVGMRDGIEKRDALKMRMVR
jgi:hypothetical protein